MTVLWNCVKEILLGKWKKPKRDAFYVRYNTLSNDYGYGQKFELGNVQKFIIEGMKKVRDVIAKNRKRKLTKHKKLSNNTIIEIDTYFHLEILKLQENLMTIVGRRDCIRYWKREIRTLATL